jgi:hypothetical protein
MLTRNVFAQDIRAKWTYCFLLRLQLEL